jgi:hypothetical protein
MSLYCMTLRIQVNPKSSDLPTLSPNKALLGPKVQDMAFGNQFNNTFAG